MMWTVLADLSSDIAETARQDDQYDAIVLALGIVGFFVVCGVIAAVFHILEERSNEAAIRERGRLLARCGPVLLYADPARLRGPVPTSDVSEEDREFAITPEVKASVETAGNIAVTRGRNLAAKAAGGAITGGVGLLVWGNATETVHDSRELYLIVEADQWAYTRSLDPDAGLDARTLASAINVAARDISAAVATRNTTRRAASSATTPDRPDAAATPALLTLVHPGDRKIEVIKVIREATGWGLTRAKAATDEVPAVIPVDAARMAGVAKSLEQTGATVRVDVEKQVPNPEVAGRPATGSDRQPATDAATPSSAQEIGELAELHAAGALTDDEYATMKRRIIMRM